MTSQSDAAAPPVQSPVNRLVLGTLSGPSRLYWAIVIALALVVVIGFSAFIYQMRTGMGVAGINIPVAWGVYIVNFVFWVGIAHSGTLISAILYLFRVRWRTSIYRSAEAMTVFALMTAALFPLVHLGRVWVFYWILPYPNNSHLYPNFKSPLVWDVVAVTAYLTVSVLFFWLGLLPDLAAVRDSSQGRRRAIYHILSLGWQNRHEQWRHYARAYLCLAVLATPLVISVHSVVSWDFAMSILPGWHTTIFAPYFVAGAIHSGLATIIILLIPLRKILGLERLITVRHFEAMAQLMILTALVILYSYAIEGFTAWYSGNRIEGQFALWRATGPMAGLYWSMITGNCIVPLLFFFKRVRTSLPVLFIFGLVVDAAMWVERLVIIKGSLSHDFMPSAWGRYAPTWVEITISTAAFAWFMLLFLLFAKHAPTVPISEMKGSLAARASAESEAAR
jgi:molybdopterin-containing oxidoreductase family membrane subunit